MNVSLGLEPSITEDLQSYDSRSISMLDMKLMGLRLQLEGKRKGKSDVLPNHPMAIILVVRL